MPSNNRSLLIGTPLGDKMISDADFARLARDDIDILGSMAEVVKPAGKRVVRSGTHGPSHCRTCANRAPIVRSTGNRLLDMLSGVTPGKQSQPRYIKRPHHTNAEMKRKAIKARNRRRHKLAMKRRGHGNA